MDPEVGTAAGHLPRLLFVCTYLNEPFETSNVIATDLKRPDIRRRRAETVMTSFVLLHLADFFTDVSYTFQLKSCCIFHEPTSLRTMFAVNISALPTFLTVRRAPPFQSALSPQLVLPRSTPRKRWLEYPRLSAFPLSRSARSVIADTSDRLSKVPSFLL